MENSKGTETTSNWMQTARTKLTRFWCNEDGLGTLEMLMILAVLVIIAIAFRKWIMRWVNNIFTTTDTNITNNTSTVSLPPN